MMQVSTRRADASDYDFIWQLHCALEKQDIERTWGWDEQWQRDHFRQLVDYSTWKIVQVDGVDAGVFAVVEEADALRLKCIGLLPGFQGRGIGTRLVTGLLTRAADRNLPVRLNVLTVNERARRFYRRLGFAVVGSLDGRQVMEAYPDGPAP